MNIADAAVVADFECRKNAAEGSFLQRCHTVVVTAGSDSVDVYYGTRTPKDFDLPLSDAHVD